MGRPCLPAYHLELGRWSQPNPEASRAVLQVDGTPSALPLRLSGVLNDAGWPCGSHAPGALVGFGSLVAAARSGASGLSWWTKDTVGEQQQQQTETMKQQVVATERKPNKVYTAAQQASSRSRMLCAVSGRPAQTNPLIMNELWRRQDVEAKLIESLWNEVDYVQEALCAMTKKKLGVRTGWLRDRRGGGSKEEVRRR
eukprot:4851087-Prymnesium_polylepis.1